jgi:3-hydroxy-D-aspartate aldolase
MAASGPFGIGDERAANTQEPKSPYAEFIGAPIEELPTPALMIDLDIFERNLATMRDACRTQNGNYRPHGKAHKSATIGKMQLAAGAGGLCAAKLGEAEVFVRGGIRDVLITTAVVGRRKIARLVDLAGRAPEIKVVSDSTRNLDDLSAAAAAAKRSLTVLVDVNVGQNRTGVDTPADAVAVAQHLAKLPSLTLGGIQAYGGMNMHVAGFQNRRDASVIALDRALAAKSALEKAGFSVPILSVGGTGTYNIDLKVPGVTEIQPGSYIFMDTHYRGIGGEGSEQFTDFGMSLSVLTTVISRARGRAITDGGNKALSTDESMPAPKGLTGVDYRPGGDEHGILMLRSPNRALEVGEKVEFLPGHCDTTVNLHNVFFAVRKGVVEAVWPVEARGRVD